jgi:hypothetical protein
MKKKTDSKGPHPIQPLKNFNCHLMVWVCLMAIEKIRWPSD